MFEKEIEIPDQLDQENIKTDENGQLPHADPGETLAETVNNSGTMINELINEMETIENQSGFNQDLIKDMPKTSKGKPDAEGNYYDPDVHMSKDGKPIITKAGTYRRKPGGAAKKKTVHSTIGGIDQPVIEQQQLEQQQKMEAEKMQYQALGQTTAIMIFALGQGLGGPEWKPEPGEQEYMTASWAAYYQATGKKDLPPWMIVTVATGSYAARRINKPETQKRLGWLWGKIIGILNHIKNRNQPVRSFEKEEEL